MSSLTTLARPYAKAAFELARGDANLALWDDLLSAAATVTRDDTMAAWLHGPHADAREAVAIIAAAIGTDIDARFKGFLGVLAANDRLTLCDEVLELYQHLRAEAEKRLQVRVVSAVALQDSQAERLKTALARRFDRDITLSNEVEPGVLGGAIIYAGDQVIDGSLQGRLDRLEATLS